LKIVINTSSLLHTMTGIGQYTLQLSQKLREVDHENGYTYYCGYFLKSLPGKNHESKIWILRVLKTVFKKIPVLGRFGRPLRTMANKLIQLLICQEFDLYFEPNYIPLPEIRSKKTVTMVFDLSAVLYPEWHPRERVETFKREFPQRIVKSDAVITATHYMKKQITEHLGVPESRIFVTPIDCNKALFKPNPPEESARMRQENGVPEKYIMFVGSIEPRKNILGLLKAFVLLQDEADQGLRLVFCGPSGWKNGPVFDYIQEHRLKDRIHLMRYVTNEQLCLLYNGAQAMVYPSFYEGFGLPPLEAMSSGCPAIVSDIPVHREVCGDAVLYIDPNSPEQIAAAVRKILHTPELKTDLRRKGLEQAGRFSWEKTAKATLEIFKRVCASC
jgi:glycosyltransferase involved in cell wall biosynthesis